MSAIEQNRRYQPNDGENRRGGPNVSGPRRASGTQSPLPVDERNDDLGDGHQRECDSQAFWSQAADGRATNTRRQQRGKHQVGGIILAADNTDGAADP